MELLDSVVILLFFNSLMLLLRYAQAFATLVCPKSSPPTPSKKYSPNFRFFGMIKEIKAWIRVVQHKAMTQSFWRDQLSGACVTSFGSGDWKQYCQLLSAQGFTYPTFPSFSSDCVQQTPSQSTPSSERSQR